MKHRTRVKALEGRIKPDRGAIIVIWDGQVPTIKGADEATTPEAVKELAARHKGPIVHVTKDGFGGL